MESNSPDAPLFDYVAKRAAVRPCTLAGLVSLERQLNNGVREWRQEREKQRELTPIDSESAELRRAHHQARLAVRSALRQHASARLEIQRLETMVKRGHVHQAAAQLLRLQWLSNFSDLDLTFVAAAGVKQEARQRRLVTAGMVVAAIIILLAAFLELMKRTSHTSP